jgi:hypothetical protein
VKRNDFGLIRSNVRAFLDELRRTTGYPDCKSVSKPRTSQTHNRRDKILTASFSDEGGGRDDDDDDDDDDCKAYYYYCCYY